MAKSVSQSRTMWVAAGTVVNGKKVPKGYLAQYGKPEKKVTGNVKMVKKTGGVEAGKTQSYKQGRRTTAPAKSPKRTVTEKPERPKGKSARDIRLEQNKGVKAGTVRASANGRGLRSYNATTGKWDLIKTKTRGVSNVKAAEGRPAAPKPRTPISGTVQSAMQNGPRQLNQPAVRRVSDWVTEQIANVTARNTPADRKVNQLRDTLSQKRKDLAAASARQSASAAEKARQDRLRAEIAALDKQIKGLK